MAPTSAAERQRKRREKLKASGKYDEYKARNTNYNKTYKKKKNMAILSLKGEEKRKVLDEIRMKEKVKKRLQRAKKQSPIEILPQNKKGFNTSQGLSKATNKVKKLLPKSPTKKREVVKLLFKQIDMTAKVDKARDDGLPGETIELVKAFYQRDDVSRISPGKRDIVTVRNSGGKFKLQKRHLYFSLKEAFALFQEEYPTIKIGLSKFCTLRPEQVKLSAETPSNVCTCIYHQNFILALDALHSKVPQIPSYSKDFPGSCLAEPENDGCWFGECSHDDCGFCDKYPLPGDIIGENAKWFRWEEVNGRYIKNTKNGTVDELYFYIAEITPKFLKHCCIKRRQAKSYEDDKQIANMPESTMMMLQMDFAENFKCVAQDEVQTAHWNQSQVTLFTTVRWYCGDIHSEVIVSDCLKHGKMAIIVFLDELLKRKPINVSEVKIWTDGPLSQFKNKYVMSALNFLSTTYKIRIIWNFSATSHGKGPVDGVGAAVKRQAECKIRCRKSIINNVDDFYHAVCDLNNIDVVKISSLEIQQKVEELNLPHIFDNALAIPGISELHCIEYDQNNEGYIKKKYSSEKIYNGSDTEDNVDSEEDGSSNVGVNDISFPPRFALLKELSIKDVEESTWVKVIYEEEVFIGKVLEKVNGEARVRCLEKPFGIDIGSPQDMEREPSAVFYNKVYEADVNPHIIKQGRKWKYIYNL